MDLVIKLISAWAPLVVFVGLFVWYMSRKHRDYMAMAHDAIAATRENTEAARALAARLDRLDPTNLQNSPERG